MKIARLNKNKALMLVCDVQDKFCEKVYKKNGFLEASALAIKCANQLKIPIICTEHYPKVFGVLHPSLRVLLNENVSIIEKTHFSMIEKSVQQALKSHQQRKQIILIGAETHICILQTFIDLKDRNYEVFLPLDAITSIRSWERSIAIQRMQSSGAILTSVQSMAFQMLGDYKNDDFKPISKLLKEAGSREQAISHL